MSIIINAHINAAAQARLKAGARDERTLFPISSRLWFGQIGDTHVHSSTWHGLSLSHGLRAIEGFTDDVGMASMLGGFGDDVEQGASCGAGRSR
jgi:hypothetical protein